ncbi:DUF6544 family protein [Thiococcus pfennigii]|uniref:DUF6544 family protein n=1 Tax=Thiococcus pfennigii TaxID=1057 RepID=UPI001906F6DD
MLVVIVYLLSTLGGIAVFALVGLRLFDRRAERREWTRLARLQPKDPARYDPTMVAALPEPAQRFFNFAIAPGTPLLPVVEIAMGGRFGLGPRAAPNYRAMAAHQILAAPHGFVWRMKLPGLVPVSGSDSHGWTRFRIFGLLPVARMGGDADHARSAYGRCVAEAVFWSPAAVLPRPGVVWEGVDAETARVTVSHGAFSQAVDLRIDGDGRPVAMSLLRWSDANAAKAYRWQPFGGRLSDFREVQGYRLPFEIEAGNLFGTSEYFAFYRASVIDIRFPGSGDR